MTQTNIRCKIRRLTWQNVHKNSMQADDSLLKRNITPQWSNA